MLIVSSELNHEKIKRNKAKAVANADISATLAVFDRGKRKGKHLGLALLFVIFSFPALSQTVSLGAEFGGPVGFSRGDGGDQCRDPSSLPFEQCKIIPHPQYATGTFTVKNNSEVFMILKCDGPNGDTDMWRGEHFQGSMSFTTPPFPENITGPCWVYYEMLNNSGTSQPSGSIFEYQIVIYGRDGDND